MTPGLRDVVIVGGGPAGLSAALILGRSRRAVLVCDTGHPRNYASHAMHGYLSRDGMPPSEFLAAARRDLAKYSSVELRDVEVTSAGCRPDGRFDVTLATGECIRTRKLLVATGVVEPAEPKTASCTAAGVPLPYARLEDSTRRSLLRRAREHGSLSS